MQVRPAKQRKTFTFKVGSFKGRREYLLREELVKTRRILSVTIQLALGVSILSVAILLLLDHFKIIETVKPFVVMSGSMNPAVKLGSVVIVKPESSYRPGDIITYAPDGNKENPITHRIVFRKFPEGPAGEPVYITAGDANDDFDSVQVGPANVIGRVQFSIPYLGYLVSLAKQPYGFILFVIVPATIVIYEELKILLGELRKSGSKMLSWVRYKRKTKDPSGPDQRQIPTTSLSINLLGGKEKSFPKAGAFIPVIGTILVLAAFTSAFYSDEEKSSGNIFGAAESFGPQIAQTLVVNELLPNSSCAVGPKPGIWLEVFNGYNTSVDLKDFDLFDGTNTIALLHSGSLTLDPGEFGLLAHDQSIWNGCEPDRDTSADTGQLGTGSFNLNSQFIQLRDPGDVVIDTVQWGGSGEATPAQNQSIERVPIGLDSAIGTSWESTDFIVRQNPTPGYGSNLVLNEYLPNNSVEPNEWVEIFNPSGSPVNLNGWNLEDTLVSPSSKSITGLGTINPSAFKFYDVSGFWLNNSGDTLKLKDSSGKIIDQHTYTATTPDSSIGRKEDRHTDWVDPCSTVSKGTTNTGFCQP